MEEEETGPPVPELTDEEVDKLVKYIKKMTTLYDLEDTDWNESHFEIIKSFIFNTDQIVLTVYFYGDDLRCSLDFPTTPISDLTYFIRKPFDILTPENFHDNITFGTVNDSIEGSLLKVLENVYAPIFFNITSWPDSILSNMCLMNNSYNKMVLKQDNTKETVTIRKS